MKPDPPISAMGPVRLVIGFGDNLFPFAPILLGALEMLKNQGLDGKVSLAVSIAADMSRSHEV